MSVPIPCVECGRLSDRNRCVSHRPVPKRKPKPSPSRRGYDKTWRLLSKTARALSPICADCGATIDLTADHLRWPALSLDDVEVVCRSCNSARGARRLGGVPIEGSPEYPTRYPQSGIDCEGES